MESEVMSEGEIEARAKLVIAEHELKELREWKEKGRPLVVPFQLLPNEYNWLFDYMVKQQKILAKEIKRAKRLNKKDNPEQGDIENGKAETLKAVKELIIKGL